MQARSRKLLTLVADRLRPLACDPPPQHWLSSDASLSYCWDCARKARWLEMGNEGEPPVGSSRFGCDDGDQEFFDGIDGGSWYSGESDTPQACETCGILLSFSLTSHGVSYTMEGFQADSIDASTLTNPSAVYELREVLEQGAWIENDDKELVASLVATARAVRSLLPRQRRAA